MSINLEALDPEAAMRALQQQRVVRMLAAAVSVALALVIGIAIVAVGFSGGPSPNEPSGEPLP